MPVAMRKNVWGQKQPPCWLDSRAWARAAPLSGTRFRTGQLVQAPGLPTCTPKHVRCGDSHSLGPCCLFTRRCSDPDVRGQREESLGQDRGRRSSQLPGYGGARTPNLCCWGLGCRAESPAYLAALRHHPGHSSSTRYLPAHFCAQSLGWGCRNRGSQEPDPLPRNSLPCSSNKTGCGCKPGVDLAAVSAGKLRSE